MKNIIQNENLENITNTVQSEDDIQKEDDILSMILYGKNSIEYKEEYTRLNEIIKTERIKKYTYFSISLYTDFYKDIINKLLNEIDIFHIIGIPQTYYQDKFSEEQIYDDYDYHRHLQHDITNNLVKIIKYIYYNNLSNYLSIITMLKTICIYNLIKDDIAHKCRRYSTESEHVQLLFRTENIEFFSNLKNIHIEKSYAIKIRSLSGEILNTFEYNMVKYIYNIFKYLSSLYTNNYSLIIDGIDYKTPIFFKNRINIRPHLQLLVENIKSIDNIVIIFISNQDFD